MPRARVVRPAERPYRHDNKRHKLEASQATSTPSQHLSRIFFLGASSPNARTTSSSKEIQHQGQTQTRKEPTSSGAAQDDSSLSIPIPETGIHPTLAQVPGYPPDVDFPESTLTVSNSPMTAAGSAPTLLSSLTVPFSSVTTVSAIANIGMTWLPNSSTSTPSPLSAIRSTNQQRTLSSTLIVVLAIGAGSLVLFVFIFIKICTRPRGHPRLTPSLPILDKGDLDNLESKESPIFGGKERLSPKMDPEDEWTSARYASLLPALPQPLRIAGCGAGIPMNECKICKSHRSGNKASYPESSVCDFHGPQTPCNLNDGSSRLSATYQAPYQQIQDAITQTMKRLSSVSLSLYPASPPQNDVGIALGGQETPLTGDGYFYIPRSKSKNYKIANRQSRQSHGLVHNGFDEDAPSITCPGNFVASQQSLTQGGRTRIMSPYYVPGIYSRLSISSTLNPSSKLNKMILPRGACEDPNTEHTSSRAPTSYQVPSCQTIATLQGDSQHVQDSSGVKEAYQTSDNQAKATSPLTPDPAATLGTLLISEYPSEMNKSGKHSAEREEAVSGGDPVLNRSLKQNGKKSSQGCRTSDKPPRVPSPPQLPSLAQMAMELRNREDFDNYRSPTYSIYGLYDGESKSNGTSC